MADNAPPVPVVFDELVWKQEHDSASAKARARADEARLQYEKHGVPRGQLLSCAAEGNDGTQLPGHVKVRIPHPDGPWGFVFAVTIDEEKRAVLHFRAFGMRHPPKASNKPSVYERADRRLRKDRSGAVTAPAH